MKFAVIEKKNETNSLVGWVNAIEDYIETIKQSYPIDGTYDQTNQANLSTANDGLYLITSEKTLDVIRKETVLSTGYIYNSSYSQVTPICSWYLVSNKLPSRKKILSVGQYNLSKLGSYPIINIVGKDSHTKLIKSLVTNFYPNPNILVFTPRESTWFKDTYPSARIEKDFNDSVIGQFLNTQENSPNKQGVLILNDCFASNQRTISKSKHLTLALNKNDHYKLLVILVMSRPLTIRPEFRDRLSSIFISEENVVFNQKKLYVQYASLFDTFRYFRDTFLSATKLNGSDAVGTTQDLTKPAQPNEPVCLDELDQDVDPVELEVDCMEELDTDTTELESVNPEKPIPNQQDDLASSHVTTRQYYFVVHNVQPCSTLETKMFKYEV